MKKANPEYGVAESGRELGAMWKAATDEDKQVCAVPRVVLTILPRLGASKSKPLDAPALALTTITAYRNISSKQRRTRRGIPRRLQRKYPSFRQNFAMFCLVPTCWQASLSPLHAEPASAGAGTAAKLKQRKARKRPKRRRKMRIEMTAQSDLFCLSQEACIPRCTLAHL